MDNTVIIGFGYKARHGKDESVKAIIAERGGQYDVRQYAFGTILKEEVNAAAEAAGGMLELFKQGGVQEGDVFTPFAEWVIYDADAPMDDPLCPLGKHRTLLQWWGTELRRQQDTNYWVKKLAAVIEAERPRIALISDMRFPNEVSWIKSDRNSGFVCRVDRIGYKSAMYNHPSETALDFMSEEDWHYIIQVGDGNVEELKRDAVVVFDLIVAMLTPPDLSDFNNFSEKIIKVVGELPGVELLSDSNESSEPVASV